MMTTLADLISRADHDRLAELAEIVVALMREPGSPANPGREPLRLSPPLLVRSWCPPAPVGRSWCLVSSRTKLAQVSHTVKVLSRVDRSTVAKPSTTTPHSGF